jgi:hypothetical protein
MCGIGSSELKNNKTGQFKNKDFIGFYGSNNGWVYDEKNRNSIQVKSGHIVANDIIRV